MPWRRLFVAAESSPTRPLEGRSLCSGLRGALGLVGRIGVMGPIGLVCLLGFAGPKPALAHDTWFEAAPARAGSPPMFLLGTGDVYPRFDAAVAPEHLERVGCRIDGGTIVRPTVTSRADGLLQLQLPSTPQRRASCWAQLFPATIELDDGIVEAYFKEAQPPTAVRQAWDQQRANGTRWQERYVKHARIEWFAPTAAATPASVPTAAASASVSAAASADEASPMDVDVVLLSAGTSPRVGEPVEFLVTRQGRPLAHQAVEFRVHASRFGVWRRTDAEGRVRMALPVPGRWVLRGIELTPPSAAASSSNAPAASPQSATSWQGLFFTLAFDIGSAPARP